MRDSQTRTRAAVLPWKETPDEVACNFALGHLYPNLRGRLTVDGRIHAETYISAVGAIAGYAAQRTLFAEHPSVIGGLHEVRLVSGERLWFGDPLNDMLVPKTDVEASRCVWSQAAGGAVNAGIKLQQLQNSDAMSAGIELQLPSLDAMFEHVASTIGGANEGKSSVPPQHQPHLPARDLLRAVWPVAVRSFSGKFSAFHEYPAAPVAWWSAIAAQASNRPIRNVSSVLPPDIALTLLMETAIYCSKLDPSRVDGATPQWMRDEVK